MSQRAAFVSFVVVVVAGVGVGCPLDLSVPKETIILCDDNADCPAPRVCATRVGRCVDAERIDDPAITITSVDVERVRMSKLAPFDANVVTVKTAFVPRTIEVRFADAALDCVTDDDDDTVVRCAFTAPDVAGDTDIAVVVNASDDLGNVATASVGIVIDVTAPALLPATVVSRYLGASDNPRLLDGLVAARAGTVVEVGLAFNEPCASAPDVRGQHVDGDDLVFTNDDEIALPAVAFFVQRLVESSDKNGRYGIAASCLDAVGNSADVAIDDVFFVDNAAPAAIEVDLAQGDEGHVTLLRAPWGRAVDGVFVGAEAHVVRGPTATDDTTLRVDVFGPALLGSGAQAADGAFDVALLVGDVRVVEVQVVDGAGNVSPRRAVRNVEWTATLGNKIVGSVFENPHTVAVTRAVRTTLQDAELREVDAAATLVVDDNAVVAETGLSWQQVDLGDDTRPQGRGFAAAAFDPVRGVITMAGGNIGFARVAETSTWLHRGRRWQAQPQVAPGIVGQIARGAQDSRRDRFVVVGHTGGVVEFDGVAWIIGASLPIGSTAEGAFAFDPIAGRSVWVSVDSRVFTYDGVVWREVDGPAPPPRTRAAFGFDDSLGGLVLFGGISPQNVELRDTWLFADEQWQQLDVVGPTAGVAFAEDPAGGLLLLRTNDDEGGTSGVARFVDGAWQNNVVDVDSVRPPLVNSTVWVTDATSGDVICFSGFPQFFGSSERMPQDTWRFDGARWQQEVAQANAPTVSDFSSATDKNGNVIMLGRNVTLGFGPGGGVGITDAVSHFNVDTGWSSLLVEPRPGVGHTTMARRGDEVIALGVPRGPTFSWNADTRRFTTRNDGAPDAARAVLATLDDATVLLVGGGSGGDQTWRYDGVTWTLVCAAGDGTLCPSSPALERQHPAAAGLHDGIVVVYDGVAGATLLFADGAWSTVGGAQPPPRNSPRMGRHNGRDSLVLFGGATSDTWELRCAAPCSAATARWYELRTVFSPAPHDGHGVVSLGDDVMLVGDNVFGETFILQAGDDVRPAVQVRFSVGAAGHAGELQSIHVDATARARGPGGTGLQLLGWQRGQYKTLATAAANGGLSWSTAQSQEIADSLFAAGQDVIVAVTSDGGGVADDLPTSVDLDAIELRLRYRLPAP